VAKRIRCPRPPDVRCLLASEWPHPAGRQRHLGVEPGCRETSSDASTLDDVFIVALVCKTVRVFRTVRAFVWVHERTSVSLRRSHLLPRICSWNFRVGWVDQNCFVNEPVLLLHGYDSKPSALGDVADLLGSRAELVAGFEDLPAETFAWWLDDLSPESRQDLTEYLDEIALEASRALGASKVSGLAGMLASKTAAVPTHTGTIAAVGFSQGAAGTLSWLLDPNRKTAISSIIAVAGFLPDLVDEELRARTTGQVVSEGQFAGTTHIHAVHLSDDEVVDAMVSERASRQLAKAGFTVTNHHVDGPHAWSSALTELVGQILR
jgi:predicted esterase